MKTTTYNGEASRRVLAGMVTDPVVLGRIAGRWQQGGLFAGRTENLVGGWCVAYHRKFGGAPGREIQTRFNTWAASASNGDEKLVEQVGRALQAISDEYERDGDGRSSEYVLDLAGNLFNQAALRRLVEDVQADLDAGDVKRAAERVGELHAIELGTEDVFRPGVDWDVWQEAFDAEGAEVLIEYPGALGRFFGQEFCRDSFVAFQASSKRGKSWWLLDAAFRAVKRKRRVAYFEAGDLSRRQVVRRMARRAARLPREAGRIEVPVGYPSVDEGPATEHRDLPAAAADSGYAAWKRVLNGQDRFRLSCHSNSSLTLAHASALLADWAVAGWAADVVVIDYADILAPPAGVREARDQINENWKHMRRISQELHCLVLTATQSDAASYDQRLQRRKNFSDDRRKHDHVTFMAALNVTDEDKARGITRVNVLDRREGAFVEGRECHVAGCLEIGCPVMYSTM